MPAAQEGKAYNAQSQPIPLGGEEKRDAIAAARTAEDLWQVIGEDSWSVVPIQSTLHPNLTLEGTRLTLVRLNPILNPKPWLPPTARWHTACTQHMPVA